jgi:hypothetical protein
LRNSDKVLKLGRAGGDSPPSRGQGRIGDEGQAKRRRGLDALGWLFVLALVVLAIGAGAALLVEHIFTPWNLAAVLVVGVAFAVAGAPALRRPIGEGMAHGMARPASEAEAQAAARGKAKPLPVHQQRFED